MMNWIQKNKVQTAALIIVAVITNYLSAHFRIHQEDTVRAFSTLFSNPLSVFRFAPLSLHVIDLGITLMAAFAVFLLLLDRKANKKHFRKGVHGSAQWGDWSKDLKGMYAADSSKNMILSQNIQKVLSNTGVPYPLQRNNNVVVIGGSGSGKTRFFIKPNLMQTNADFVVTDPKGTILHETGYILRKANYKIKVLNLNDLTKSMRYNPFRYIDSEQDILKVVETIIKNTSGNSKEDFWVKAERLLYQAYISVILSRFPQEEHHLGTVIDLLELSVTKQQDENYKNAIDLMFDEIAEEEPDAFCVKQYRQFKLAAGETMKSILISCGARLAAINIPAVRQLLSQDELHLEQLGCDQRPIALFVVIPDTDSTFNFIAAILYSQMLNILCSIADTTYDGSLPRHVRFMLDEFANVGVIPEFDKTIATIRSRNISASVMLQTLSQLKKLYKDNAETIIGNCDTLVFLGGKEASTLKMISEQLGKETIDDYNVSRTRSNTDSYNQNYSKVGRQLLTVDELQIMPRQQCIVMILGLNPFKDNKYDIEQHPLYPYHGNDASSRYWFDYEKYLRHLREKQPASKH